VIFLASPANTVTRGAVELRLTTGGGKCAYIDIHTDIGTREKGSPSC